MLRAAVADVVRPIVEKIVDQLTDELVGHLEVRVEHALQAARAALCQTELPWALTEVRIVELDGRGPAPVQSSGPSPILETAPLATPAEDTPPSAGVTHAGKKQQACAKCGAPGRKSSTCGISHSASWRTDASGLGRLPIVSTTPVPARAAEPRTPPIPSVARQPAPASSLSSSTLKIAGAPSAPMVIPRERTPAQQRRDAILNRTRAALAPNTDTAP